MLQTQSTKAFGAAPINPLNLPSTLASQDLNSSLQNLKRLSLETTPRAKTTVLYAAYGANTGLHMSNLKNAEGKPIGKNAKFLGLAVFNGFTPCLVKVGTSLVSTGFYLSVKTAPIEKDSQNIQSLVMPLYEINAEVLAQLNTQEGIEKNQYQQQYFDNIPYLTKDGNLAKADGVLVYVASQSLNHETGIKPSLWQNLSNNSLNCLNRIRLKLGLKNLVQASKRYRNLVLDNGYTKRLTDVKQKILDLEATAPNSQRLVNWKNIQALTQQTKNQIESVLHGKK